jgi:hypothetical protein
MINKPMHIRERTFQFGLGIIRSIEKIPHSRAGNAIANQLIRSATFPSVLMQKKLLQQAAKLTSSIKLILHFVKLGKRIIGYDY